MAVDNLYYRKYDIQFYNLSIFSDIKPFTTSHGDNRFREVNYNGNKYIIKQHRTNSKKDYENAFLTSNTFFTYENTKLLLSINEIMASVIYNRVFKLYSPEIILVQDDNNTYNANKEYMVGSKMENNLKKFDNTKFEDIIKGFFADCIMANWDIMVGGNTFYTNKNTSNNSPLPNRITRLDVGGSMYFRAQGLPKIPFIQNTPPGEHISLINHNVFYKANIGKNELDISMNYIKSIYEKEKFTKLDKVRDDLLNKMRELFGSNDIIIADIYNLVNINIIQIKRRWLWYLIDYNNLPDTTYNESIHNNIIRNEKVSHWNATIANYINSSKEISIKSDNCIRIMTFNMGHTNKPIKTLLDKGVDIECYQETPVNNKDEIGDGILETQNKDKYKLKCDPKRNPFYGTNTINYDDKKINTYGKILIKDGFELKDNKANKKFASNGKCVNVLGIELNNKKKLIIFNVHLDVKADEIGLKWRIDSLKLIIERYKDYEKQGYNNAIILGDFNSYNHTEYIIDVNDDKNQLKQLETAKNSKGKYWDNTKLDLYGDKTNKLKSPCQILKDYGFVEAFEIMGINSPVNTSHYSGKTDFIWLSPLWDIDIKGLYCGYDTYGDHLPLLIDIENIKNSVPKKNCSMKSLLNLSCGYYKINRGKQITKKNILKINKINKIKKINKFNKKTKTRKYKK